MGTLLSGAKPLGFAPSPPFAPLLSSPCPAQPWLSFLSVRRRSAALAPLDASASSRTRPTSWCHLPLRSWGLRLLPASLLLAFRRMAGSLLSGLPCWLPRLRSAWSLRVLRRMVAAPFQLTLAQKARRRMVRVPHGFTNDSSRLFSLSQSWLRWFPLLPLAMAAPLVPGLAGTAAPSCPHGMIDVASRVVSIGQRSLHPSPPLSIAGPPSQRLRRGSPSPRALMRRLHLRLPPPRRSAHSTGALSLSRLLLWFPRPPSSLRPKVCGQLQSLTCPLRTSHPSAQVP